MLVLIEVKTDMECQSDQRGGFVNKLLWETLILIENMLLKAGLLHRKSPHLIYMLLKSNLFRGWRLWRWYNRCRGIKIICRHWRVLTPTLTLKRKLKIRNLINRNYIIESTIITWSIHNILISSKLYPCSIMPFKFWGIRDFITYTLRGFIGWFINRHPKVFKDLGW